MPRVRACIVCGESTVRGSRCEKHAYKGWDSERGSSQRGYGAAWRERRRAKLAQDPHCECTKNQGEYDCCPGGCGRLADTVDHYVAKARGGTDDFSNLRSLASIPCHRRKTAHDSNRKG